MALTRRNREINIFNLSMLDVISGAMAAFLIVMVILLPYYKKESIDFRALVEQLQHQLQQLQQNFQSLEQQLQAQQQQNERLNQENLELQRRTESAEGEAKRTFLVVYIRWQTRQDIDLHVLNPAGIEFYYQHKTDPHSPGELSEDSQIGPGNEVWELHDASPGEYKVYAQLYDSKGDNSIPTITGRVIYREASTMLQPTRLSKIGEKVLMATVLIGGDGRINVQ